LKELRELGWIEGGNLAVERRYTDGQGERASRMAVDLVGLKLSVLVTVGSSATLAARDASRSLPVVFATANPVRSGLVASLARPGGNLTGVASQSSESHVKMLEVLREAFPQIRRVAVFYQPTASAQQQQFLAELEPAARTLSVHLVPLAVRAAADIGRAGPTLRREKADAFLVLSNPFFNAERQRFADLASDVRVPSIYDHRDFVEAGGLMSYGQDLREVFKRMAAQVDRILRGANPAELPVEQAMKIELVINARTARTLGVSIAPSVALRASEILQ
jgi:putative ABC transport system substrate-binding protein